MREQQLYLNLYIHEHVYVSMNVWSRIPFQYSISVINLLKIWLQCAKITIYVHKFIYQYKMEHIYMFIYIYTYKSM